MILVLGRGYIGAAFATELKARGSDYKICSREVLDYTQFSLLVDLLKGKKFQAVINCAAFVTQPSVDGCEDYRSETLLVNLVFPSVLVNACQLTGTPLLHVSTGCLYNGDNNGAGFREIDTPHLSFNTKCGTYVGSKELAEHVVRRHELSWICRVRLPFDEFDHERNLLSKLQRYSTICDETQSLAHRGDFVKACLDMIAMQVPFGTYNCTSPGAVNYAELCGKLSRVLYKGKREFKFIHPDEFDKTMARTPKSRCVLSAEKLLSTGVKIRPVDEAIDHSLNNWTT
jgi:UDP-glucose 4,6-dehydratase